MPGGNNTPNAKKLYAGGVNRAVFVTKSVTIADSTATPLFVVDVPVGQRVGGIVHFLVEAGDGTDLQAVAGIMSYSAVNKAGTITADETYATANEAKAVSSGTLTMAWTVTDDTDKITVKLEPTGSLTETLYKVTYSIFPLKGNVRTLY